MSAPRGGPLPDAVDRALAATVFDRNLVVTAGAGTGKTALLVERALNLIASGRATIRTLAAITFTEKAAAELRQRLATGLDALQRLAGPGGDPAAADLRTESGRAYRWLAGDQGISAA
ncbi:MAG TPA: UvrD-helicase domain-containing protein, partial [Candidatus Saccharimonadales bacterium]|nr:UvrD-helicase domain-containing protein [Candidatus Saccharimonadales bacterium]